MEVVNSLRRPVSGSGCGFLTGILMPMPAPVQLLSTNVGGPSEAARYREPVGHGRAVVMSWVEPGSTGAVSRVVGRSCTPPAKAL